MLSIGKLKMYHEKQTKIRGCSVICPPSGSDIDMGFMALIGAEVVFSLGLMIVNIRVVIECGGWGCVELKAWMSSEDVIFIRLLVSTKYTMERKNRKQKAQLTSLSGTK